MLSRGGKDLNRDFPDRFAAGGMAASGQEQPETKAIMAWSQRVGFVASASMHEVRWGHGVGARCCPGWPATLAHEILPAFSVNVESARGSLTSF